MQRVLGFITFFCIAFLGYVKAENSEYEFVGFHLVLNYLDCDPERIADLENLRAAMNHAVQQSGATLLKTVDYVFPPDGLTMVMLLSESHASIHTYPEHRACFVDFFTCGRNCSAEKFDQALQEYLHPKKVNSRLLCRDEKISEIVIVQY